MFDFVQYDLFSLYNSSVDMTCDGMAADMEMEMLVKPYNPEKEGTDLSLFISKLPALYFVYYNSSVLSDSQTT